MKGMRALVLLCALILLGIFVSRENESFLRASVDYQVPEVTLLDQTGQKVALRSYLECDKPLLLNFSFTSCTTVCADQAAKFANLQRRLGKDTASVRLVSISIDPETDRPEVLQDFMQRFQAQPGWDFLTGSKEAVQRVMSAFDITPANMFSADSAMLVRHPKSGEWTRISGRLDSKSLWQEYQRLTGE